MARVKTFTNGGFIFPGDLNAIEDDYEQAFSQYKHGSLLDSAIYTNGSQLASGSTYALTYRSISANTLLTADPGGNIYLDPADLTAGGRTNKYRLKVVLLTNATAPTSTFTVGLYPITGAAGGNNTNTQTVGAVTPGSTVAFAAPAASAAPFANSGDFAAPAAGYYAIGVAITVATMVANSSIVIRAALQARQV